MRAVDFRVAVGDTIVGDPHVALRISCPGDVSARPSLLILQVVGAAGDVASGIPDVPAMLIDDHVALVELRSQGVT